MTRLFPTMPTTEPEPSQTSQTATSHKTPTPVELLILGAGWTSTFLIPLLQKSSITYAATSTTGHDSTLPFRFDATTSTLQDFATLPTAPTVLITFPLTGNGPSKTLVDLYLRSRPSHDQIDTSTLFIQLGSTGIFTAPHWNTHKSSYDTSNARAIAEDELLSLASTSTQTTVLNLAGLYGPPRDPKAWLPRVIKRKSDISKKLALHLVHGRDVARAILGAHQRRESVAGQRWIVNDLHVYDWWDLIYEWSGTGSGKETLEVEGDGEGERKVVVLKEAVLEYMREKGVRALPRGPEELGRVLDGRHLWEAIGCWPEVGRVT